MLRWAEDYTTLLDQPLRGIDRLKYIPLDPAGRSHLSLGGSIREQFEFYNNRDFGFAEADDDAFLLHRLMVHADLHVDDGVRVFAELGNTRAIGLGEEPPPLDENRLFLHQGFIDLAVVDGLDGMPGLDLRVGRQEMPLGSARLISLRDGPNNRLSFDAARATVSGENWATDVFAATPVDLQSGVFDDQINDETLLWGAYGTLHEIQEHTSVDLYYIGIHRDERRFGNAFGDEVRHSVGTRIFGHTNGFDFNTELVYQFGSIGSADIAAGTIANDFGYTWASAPWAPRVGIRLDYSSGARGAGSTTETFDPLFPKNNYFSEAAVIFPANIIDVNPNVTVYPTEHLAIEIMWDFLWRASPDDAVYIPPGRPLFAPTLSDGRFIGNSLSLLAEYHLARGTSVNAAFTFFDAGNAVRDAGGEDIVYAAAWVEFKF
ncbi:MAG: alginate export family protein [Planctomycetota bacterium]